MARQSSIDTNKPKGEAKPKGGYATDADRAKIQALIASALANGTHSWTVTRLCGDCGDWCDASDLCAPCHAKHAAFPSANITATQYIRSTRSNVRIIPADLDQVLIYWGERNRPDVVRAIGQNINDQSWWDRCIANLFRARAGQSVEWMFYGIDQYAADVVRLAPVIRMAGGYLFTHDWLESVLGLAGWSDDEIGKVIKRKRILL